MVRSLVIHQGGGYEFDRGRTPVMPGGSCTLPSHFCNPSRRTYVNRIRRGHKVLALAAAATMVIAACGSDDDSGSSDTTADSTAGIQRHEAPAGTEAPSRHRGASRHRARPAPTAEGEEPAGEAVFRITYELSDTAVWNDGTADHGGRLRVHRRRRSGTPGSLSPPATTRSSRSSEGDSPTADRRRDGRRSTRRTRRCSAPV